MTTCDKGLVAECETKRNLLEGQHFEKTWNRFGYNPGQFSFILCAAP